MYIYIYIPVLSIFVLLPPVFQLSSLFYNPHTKIHKYESAVYIPILSIFVLLPPVCPPSSIIYNPHTKIHRYESAVL